MLPMAAWSRTSKTQRLEIGSFWVAQSWSKLLARVERHGRFPDRTQRAHGLLEPPHGRGARTVQDHHPVKTCGGSFWMTPPLPVLDILRITIYMLGTRMSRPTGRSRNGMGRLAQS